MHSIMDGTTKLAHEAENCVKQAWNDVEKTATHAWHHPKQDALKFANDVEQLDIGEVKEAWNVGIHTLDAITGGPTPNAWLPLSKPSNHIQALGADLVDIATLALPVAGVGRATAEAEVAGGVFETAEASGEITTQTGFFGRSAGGLTRSLGAEAVESSQVAARSEQLAVEGGLFGDRIGAENVPIKMYGSGPTSGVISVSPEVESVKALENYSPNTLENVGIEYVYDPERNLFAVGKVNNASELGITGSPHQQLARAIKANEETVLGGTFLRGENRKIILTENSGHYGLRWNNFPGARDQLNQMLNEQLNIDIELEHWNESSGVMKNGI